MKTFTSACALLAAVICSCSCRADVLPAPQENQTLRLPSFSIFGWDKIKDPKLGVQYPEAELEKFLAEIKSSKKIPGSSGKKPFPDISFIIPLVLYRSRHLFAQAAWSTQDIEEGRRISRFFARLVNRPDLEIFSAQPGAFRDGLINLRNWYAQLCNHNTSLAAMIFTFDDGPYVGYPLPRERFSQLRLLQSSAIPGRSEKFALLTDGKTAEPMFVGVLARNGAIAWARRFSKQHDGTIGDAELFSHACDKIEGYGYVCYAGVSGEGSRIYLDEKLNLRFYFVSW